MAYWFCSVFNVVCRKRLSSPRCRSELIASAWVVIVPGQKCIKKPKKPNASYWPYDFLVRFRMGNIAIVAEIQQTFLNVEEHRNLLRFLWFREILSENLEVIILRFKRVIFGLTSSPFLLNGMLTYRVMIKLEDGKAIDLMTKLLRDLYVYSTASVNGVAEGVRIYNAAMSRLKKAGFKLRNGRRMNPNYQKL